MFDQHTHAASVSSMNSSISVADNLEPNSAFEEALASLSEDQRHELTGRNARALFAKLAEDDERHGQKSLLRRGLNVASPYLHGVSAILGFVTPFTVVEPTAKLEARPIFPDQVKIADIEHKITLVICGASEGVSGQIESFLQRIPIFDICNRSVKDGTDCRGVYTGLVNVYKDLLAFYLKAITIFKTSGFILHVTMSALGFGLKDIITSFNNHADILHQLMDAETFSVVRQERDKNIDLRVHKILDAQDAFYSPFLEGLEERDDQACCWITSHSAVALWISPLTHVNMIAMFGDMGSGKTTTTAYLAKSLSEEHLVCVYYCRGDEGTARLSTIYKRLAWQLLQLPQLQPQIKKTFQKWFENESSGSAAQSEKRLQDFLSEAIRPSPDYIFVIVDGLEEYGYQIAWDLLSFLRHLLQQQAKLKVFVSSRHDVDIKAHLPQDTVQFEIPSSPQRDRIIAAHHVNKSNIPLNLRSQALDVLSNMAEGSAIWVRIAVECLAKSRIANEIGLKNALSQVPSSKHLSELYWRLFQKSCPDLPKYEEYLQQALEILAVACRPMTAKELASAVFLNSRDSEIRTVAELDEHADSISFLDLVRPFVSTIIPKNGGQERLRLVHRSLAELIIKAPPGEWEVRGGSSKKSRLPQLHGQLLQSCVKGLLLEDFADKDFFESSADFYADLELRAFNGLFDDEENDSSVPNTPTTPFGVRFDPANLGVGAFYAYAATCWTDHLPLSSPDLRPSASDLKALCRPRSNQLKNWIELCQRLYSSGEIQWVLPAVTKLDALVIAVLFDPEVSLEAILKCDFTTSDFLPGSVWTALEYLTSRNEPLVIRKLFEHDTLGPQLRCSAFLNNIAWDWGRVGPLSEAQSRIWQDMFVFAVKHLRESLWDDINDILCVACRKGCLPLVKALFMVAESDAEIRTAILTEKRTERKYTSLKKGHENFHQSVGEAAFWGHVDVVRFLCRQPGIQRHVRYINRYSETVFHQAARNSDPEIFDILISAWPEGVKLVDENNDSALERLCFGRTSASTLESARVLLGTGRADAVCLPDEIIQKTLILAVQSGDVSLCQLLVVEGSADVCSIIHVNQETLKPSLRTFVNTPDPRDQEMVVRELCSLVPITVAIDNLVIV
ncbi:hypothetical protein FDECE_13984 [Fusarium decemcellulare]|nr:hypothetical protein FDECE_13984 [Fusarium decemcellulare]